MQQKPTWQDVTAFTCHELDTVIGTYQVKRQLHTRTLHIHLDYWKHMLAASFGYRDVPYDIDFSFAWSDILAERMDEGIKRAAGFWRLLELPVTEGPQPLTVVLLGNAIQTIDCLDRQFFGR